MFRPALVLFGGVPVYARAGEEALLRQTPRSVDQPIELGLGFAEWDRPGDWVLGGEASAQFKEWLGVGLGFVRENDLAMVSREAFTLRLSSRPLPFLDLSAASSYDVYAKAVEEGEVRAAAWLGRTVVLNGYLRYLDPALLLPSSSILSVFGSAAHSDFGLSADWYWRRARFSLGGEIRTTEQLEADDENLIGHRVFASVRFPLPDIEGARGIVAYDRLDDGRGGYDYGRTGVEVPVYRGIVVSSDAGAYIISDSLEGGVGDRLALRGTTAVLFELADSWRAVLAARGTEVPGYSNDLALIGKLEWNSEQDF